MAIYYFDVSNVSRSSGKKASSSVAASAYQNRECYTDERTGVIYDYTKKKGHFYSVLLAPENTPESLIESPLKLWTTIENVEKRKDARLAKDIKISLPIELTPEQNKALIVDFAKRAFVEKGMIVDLAIHDIDTQPHSHIKTSTREITPEGFGKKIREWDRKETIIEWRELWAKVANEHLLKAGKDITISHLTLKDQMKEALEEMNNATSLNEKIKLASKAMELDRPPMKNINKKDWRNPDFQEIRRQEKMAKNKILKKAKLFRRANNKTLAEIQLDLDNRFKTSEIYKLISSSIKSKLEHSKNTISKKTEEAFKVIKQSVKIGINKLKPVKEKIEIKPEEFKSKYKVDRFGNAYLIKDHKNWEEKNQEKINNELKIKKENEESYREKIKKEDEILRLQEQELKNKNISNNDFKNRNKKAPK